MNSTEFRNINFTGKGFEYFKLCIANFFLSLITLGIYSPWATVRNSQYLHGHTSIDNHAFQYHANPMQILKGRLIAFALLVAYIFLSTISPVLNLILILVLLGFTPLIIVRSIRFKLQMTSYRNVRFNFSGTAGQAFLVFLLYPFLAIFTLYLLIPWVMKKQKAFFFNNLHYGKERFRTELDTGVFYKIYGICLAISVAVFLVPILLFGAVDPQLIVIQIMVNPLLILAIYAPFIVLYIVNAAVYKAMMWKHITQNTQLSDVAKFDTDMTIVGLMKLHVTNVLLLIFTVGFAIPWISIRTQHYLCGHTQVAITPEIEAVMGEKNKETGALGDEASNVFDVDVGGSFI